ncbi:50S ribosomal protein L31 [Candidatus Wolfebacteria bacterium]|nr:MAG: 50S ribosomal protein L31 [Candidatus Wolfebacteria bacterium]
MKKDIHPTYNPTLKAKCACGAEYEVGTTLSELNLEICADCHPFYTGNEKILDTAGRVEKFKMRRVAAEEAKKNAPKPKPKVKKKEEEEESK